MVFGGHKFPVLEIHNKYVKENTTAQLPRLKARKDGILTGVTKKKQCYISFI